MEAKFHESIHWDFRLFNRPYLEGKCFQVRINYDELEVCRIRRANLKTVLEYGGLPLGLYYCNSITVYTR